MVSATVAVLLTPPDDAVIVRLVVPFLTLLLLHHARASKTIIAVTILSCVRSRRIIKRQNNRDRVSSSGTICRIDIGGRGVLGGSIIIPFAKMVTVDVTGVTPSAGVTGVVGVQVTGIPAPAQATVTAWLKPPDGAIVTFKLAVVPFFTVLVPGTR